MIKNPSDFVGNVIGASEANTKAILATTVGKVLIIDEAYMLYPGSSGGGGHKTDMFKTAVRTISTISYVSRLTKRQQVIDTLVAEVQSTLGEDRCVLLLGYEDQMIDMFQNVNPGLTRRFQLADAFRFEDFSDSELQEILEMKLKAQGLGASSRAISVAIDVLGRARNGLNFGNGGDVESLISKAKRNYQARQSALLPADRQIDFTFEPIDFDLDYDRASSAGTNLLQLFKGVIGCDAIINKLDGFLQAAKGMRAQGIDPRGQIPMNFIFKGPPGTGKTTTARKFGQVYFDLGFLSQVEVIECSASDLVGEYVGQTGPKTLKQLEKGLGKVLFIDEAYRLGDGHFAKEAIDEIVDLITKPKFAGKMIVILAGYDSDMNDLLRANEGLSSRFADEVYFPALTPVHCLQILETKLKESNIVFPELQDQATYSIMFKLFEQMSRVPSWGNARDTQTLAKIMVRAVYIANPNPVIQLTIPADMAIRCAENMLADKLARNTGPRKIPSMSHGARVQSNVFNQAPPPAAGTSTAAKTSDDLEGTESDTDDTLDTGDADSVDEARPTLQVVRDPGVTDEVWAQLEKDKEHAQAVAQNHEQMIRDREETVRAAAEAEKKAEEAAAALQAIETRNAAEARDLLRAREEARVRELAALAERERLQRELQESIEVERERRRKEEEAEVKLREIGLCVMGYRWIKQAGGWRCAGGSHYVSDAQLGN